MQVDRARGTVPLLGRYWMYQKERFPILTHGGLIATVASSSIGFSAALRRDGPLPRPTVFLAAFICTFLLFLQLRVADEFKDYQDDLRFRPHRPVPRGLVSLRELAFLGVAGMVVQTILTASIDSSLFLLLLLTWAYMSLMMSEFFIPRWLKAHPATYLFSHMLVVPLIVLFASAFDWHAAPTGPGPGLGWLFGTSFFTGVVLEVGRKVRAPEEEDGGESYTLLWGRERAVALWLASLGSALITASLGAARIGLALPVSAVAVTALAAAAVAGGRFLRRPTPRASARILLVSGISAMAIYLCLGVVPLLAVAAERGG